MDTKKLLGLLFEHIESGDITSFEVFNVGVYIWFNDDMEEILFNQDLLKQYNKIFNYES